MHIVRFTALWCADCIVMRPRWQQAFSDKPQIKIIDYDLDDNPKEAQQYQVTRVPEVLICNEQGEEVSRLTGMKDPEELQLIIDKFFSL